MCSERCRCVGPEGHERRREPRDVVVALRRVAPQALLHDGCESSPGTPGRVSRSGAASRWVTWNTTAAIVSPWNGAFPGEKLCRRMMPSAQIERASTSFEDIICSGAM